MKRHYAVILDVEANSAKEAKETVINIIEDSREVNEYYFPEAKVIKVLLRNYWDRIFRWRNKD